MLTLEIAAYRQALLSEDHLTVKEMMRCDMAAMYLTDEYSCWVQVVRMGGRKRLRSCAQWTPC